MNRLGSWLLLTLCIVSLLAVPMLAQKTIGHVRGVVTDPSGAVLANVPVVDLLIPRPDEKRTVITNTQGEYVAADLAVGTYTVTVKAPNFKESVSNNVDLHTSSTQTLNIQLQVGSTSEQVTVAASEVQVQTDSAALGEVVTGEQVRELPLNGRSFVQLTQLQPGVSPANNYRRKNKGLLAGVDFSVNGNASTNNLFMIDGANNNDMGSNRTILIYPSIEAISEFKMLRNSYGPEYGLASGAVINIVTKSGSNQWHGDVLYFGRNDALNADDCFASGAETDARGDRRRPLPNNGKQVTIATTSDSPSAGRSRRTNCSSSRARNGTRSVAEHVRQACVPTAAERAGNFTTTSCGEPQPANLVEVRVGDTAANPFVMTSLDPGGATAGAMAAHCRIWRLQPAGTTGSLRSTLADRLDAVQHPSGLQHQPLADPDVPLTQDSWTNNSPNGNSTLGLWGDAFTRR